MTKVRLRPTETKLILGGRLFKPGLAAGLKRMELDWAAANGRREIVTWTQRGNEEMRRLNEELGYEYRSACVTMVARLPLP